MFRSAQACRRLRPGLHDGTDRLGRKQSLGYGRTTDWALVRLRHRRKAQMAIETATESGCHKQCRDSRPLTPGEALQSFAKQVSDSGKGDGPEDRASGIQHRELPCRNPRNPDCDWAREPQPEDEAEREDVAHGKPGDEA